MGESGRDRGSHPLGNRQRRRSGRNAQCVQFRPRHGQVDLGTNSRGGQLGEDQLPGQPAFDLGNLSL